MNYESTHLYLLVYPKTAQLKIGKANVIFDRSISFKKLRGIPDYQNSYFLKFRTELVFKIEKALRVFLHSYLIEGLEGDGKTEIYQLEALPIALEYLEIFTKSLPDLEIIKGVPVPPKPAVKIQKKIYPRNIKTLYGKADRFYSSIEESNTNLKKLNYLIILLIRFQDILCYQYNWSDSRLYFRIKGNFSEKNRDKIFRICQLKVEDIYGASYMNLCVCIAGDSEITQFEFIPGYDELIVKGEEMDYHHNLFTYMIKQSKALLKKLPYKSSFMKEDLPIIKHDFASVNY